MRVGLPALAVLAVVSLVAATPPSHASRQNGGELYRLRVASADGKRTRVLFESPILPNGYSRWLFVDLSPDRKHALMTEILQTGPEEASDSLLLADVHGRAQRQVVLPTPTSTPGPAGRPTERGSSTRPSTAARAETSPSGVPPPTGATFGRSVRGSSSPGVRVTTRSPSKAGAARTVRSVPSCSPIHRAGSTWSRVDGPLESPSRREETGSHTRRTPPRASPSMSRVPTGAARLRRSAERRRPPGRRPGRGSPSRMAVRSQSPAPMDVPSAGSRGV